MWRDPWFVTGFVLAFGIGLAAIIINAHRLGWL